MLTDIQSGIQQRWGTLPHIPEGLEAWAQRVAQAGADQHPAAIDDELEAQEAQATSGPIATRQLAEQQQLRVRVYGKTGRAPEGGPTAHAGRGRNRAEAMRRTLNMIESLRDEEAAQLLRQQRAQAEARRVEAERARVERAEQVAITELVQPSRTDPHRERSIGF